MCMDNEGADFPMEFLILTKFESSELAVKKT